MTAIRCPECKSTDIRFRHDGAFTLTMMPPIHCQAAFCVACGCEWQEKRQTWDDTDDWNPNLPYKDRSRTNRWQDVTKHGNQWRENP